MTTPITEITLDREKKANKDGSVLGTLTVGKESFPTIERGNGYVSLKVGKYEMTHSTKNKGRKVHCLRPIETEIQTLLVHDALNDDSNNLEGCVAPGMTKKESGMGIRRSKEAMEKVWELLGGWEAGKKITLNVLSNVPGGTGTRETWKRLE